VRKVGGVRSVQPSFALCAAERPRNDDDVDEDEDDDENRDGKKQVSRVIARTRRDIAERRRGGNATLRRSAASRTVSRTFPARFSSVVGDWGVRRMRSKEKEKRKVSRRFWTLRFLVSRAPLPGPFSRSGLTLSVIGCDRKTIPSVADSAGRQKRRQGRTGGDREPRREKKRESRGGDQRGTRILPRHAESSPRDPAALPAEIGRVTRSRADESRDHASAQRLRQRERPRSRAEAEEADAEAEEAEKKLRRSGRVLQVRVLQVRVLDSGGEQSFPFQATDRATAESPPQ
jgi:hypothetical protein